MRNNWSIAVAAQLACLTFTVPVHAAGLSGRDALIDRAIERGLDFLVTRQRENGSFNSGQGETVGVVGLAGMAFLARGHIPGEPPYGMAIDRCIDYILATSKAGGGWMGDAGRGRMYSHAIGALFLSEVSGMVDAGRQEPLDHALARALRLILDAQAVEKPERHAGGWRYGLTSSDSDTSVTGWCLMALRSARLNGAPVPTHAIDDAVAYTLRHHDIEAGSFGYTDTRSNAITLTGAGLLTLALSGRHDHPAVFAAARFLMQNFHALPQQRNALYGLYYTSQGLFQIGGDAWHDFENWMVDYWLPAQRPDGSWDRGEQDCSVYQTAMCLLSLTVPYRQLPIYQRDETVDE